MTGGAIYGLSAAMGQEITFKDGMVEQSNFHDFDAMRIFQAPQFRGRDPGEFSQDGRRRRSRRSAGRAGAGQRRLCADGKRIRSLPSQAEVKLRMRQRGALHFRPTRCCGLAAHGAGTSCAAQDISRSRRLLQPSWPILPRTAGLGKGLRGVLPSALRQLPCRGRAPALVRRALRRERAPPCLQRAARH
jgi:hypothetical protein